MYSYANSNVRLLSMKIDDKSIPLPLLILYLKYFAISTSPFDVRLPVLPPLCSVWNEDDFSLFCTVEKSSLYLNADRVAVQSAINSKLKLFFYGFSNGSVFIVLSNRFCFI